MTICALLLARQFYDLEPSTRLKYATLGLLFVNVSIGGTLTHFAAPPVLMVARPWGWDTGFMLGHFGWRAVLVDRASRRPCTIWLFRRDLAALAARVASPDVESPDEEAPTGSAALLPVPAWITVVHLLFLAWSVSSTPTIRCCFSAASCSSWASFAPPLPIRAASSCARRCSSVSSWPDS